jgi:hypothetical protein
VFADVGAALAAILRIGMKIKGIAAKAAPTVYSDVP